MLQPTYTIYRYAVERCGQLKAIPPVPYANAMISNQNPSQSDTCIIPWWMNTCPTPSMSRYHSLPSVLNFQDDQKESVEALHRTRIYAEFSLDENPAADNEAAHIIEGMNVMHLGISP